MKRIPEATRISQWNTATEIIFQCPTCKCSFNFYGKYEKFCHNCGQAINWDHIPDHVKETWGREYHNSDYQTQKLMIKDLNKCIKKHHDKESQKYNVDIHCEEEVIFYESIKY